MAHNQRYLTNSKDMINTRDITIAGAGPAGLTAAIILAKAGCRVQVFEQHSGVGRRFNDDFQGLENWSREEDVLEEVTAMGISPESWWHRTFYGGVLYDPSLRPIRVQSERPLFYMVRRGHTHPASLDLALLDQAREAGVEFVWNQRLGAPAANIVASGPCGVPMAIARGMTFHTELEDLACGILNDEMAPAGYVYFLVADHQATLATVLFEKFGEARNCLGSSLDGIKRLYAIKEMDEVRYWGGYAFFNLPTSCSRNGSLWIGEAAGFQDNLFGFGIRNALVSAKLAAQSIIENRSYDALWRARLLPHLKATLVSRTGYQGLGDFAKRGFWHLTGKNARPDRFMRWLYNFSPLHRALYPLALTRLPKG